MIDQRQRVLGCIIGGAIGDGLGAPLEGTSGISTVPSNTILDITDVVMLGGDADTIGSITGQIVGAAVGIEGIPERMVERLRERRMIGGIVEKFAEAIDTIDRGIS